MNLVSKNEKPEPFRPFCFSCGWRKGGIDSWDGVACKCGFTALPIEIICEPTPKEPKT